MERAEIESKILTIMMFWAIGSKEAKSREFILSKVNTLMPVYEQLDDRQFRNIYTDMKPKYLLGSHSDYGYFTITCKKDLELTLQSYDKKAESIAITKNMIFKRYQEKYGTIDRQIEMIL